jgi:signal transduction histidine kinase
MDSTLLPCTAKLEGAAFERAFPFHLHVAADGRLRGFGRSLAKIAPGLAVGQPWDAMFEIRRPQRLADPAQWPQLGQQLCVVRLRGDPPTVLRGSAQLLPDGSLLLLLSAMLQRLADMHRLGLSFEDFAAHDGIGDTLQAHQAAQMSLGDAQELAERLQHRTQQLELVLDLSSNAVAYFGADGTLQLANAGFARVLDKPRGDLPGTTLAQAGQWLLARLDDNSRPAPDQPDPLQRLAADPERAGGTLGLTRGETVQLNGRRSPAGGLVVYLRDVTAEAEVDRMKTEFLSTAAHELRTPMASIYGFSELLMKRQMSPEKTRELAGIIHRQSAWLVDMVNELLDLARIESRRGRDFRIEPVEVASLLEDATRSLASTGGTDRIRVMPQATLTRVRADAGKARHALANVLANAVKYSPGGGPILVHSVDAELEGRPGVAVSVVDHGIGMTPEQLERVFERFYRADPSGNIPGTGLGMSLVREIMELHGGRVRVASTYGRGTTVELWFPAAGGQAEGVAACVPAAESSPVE